MRHYDAHLSEEDLLLAIDGELSGSRAEQVEQHLAACWDCRARKQNLERAIGNLVTARHAELDPQIPAEAGPRALLKARLAQAAAEPRELDQSCSQLTPGGASVAPTNAGGRFAVPMRSTRIRRALVIAFATAAAIAVIVGGVARVRMQNSEVYAEGPLEPRPVLTPGAVRTVDAAEVCSASVEDDRQVLVIPASVREEVFREYGMSAAKPQFFEVDFLITPELGGSNDIKNLWPEPYRAPVWNAHVKDQLENFLRDKVCKGEMDLSAAQHDIAADWIVAYKKYFHTDRPL
jgi:anti-sigma factor RsiW